MIQTPSSKSSTLNEILQTIPQLSQDEILELIAYLAQQAQQPAAQHETYYWGDLAGIAPDLLKGQDAQEWINNSRREWDRDRPK